MPPPAPRVVSFGVFDLDLASGELRRHGLKVRLPDQSFQILKALLARAGEVVTREELRQVLWTADTFVDFEVGMNSAVRKLREALDDSADNPRFVETLPRRGYRFIAALQIPAVDEPMAVNPPAEPLPLLPPDPALPSNVAAVAAPPAQALPRPANRSNLWRAAAVAAIVLAAAGLAAYQGFAGRRAAGEAGPITGVLVLPFENLTGDAGQDYFVDSVSDAVTLDLAQIGGLEVISRATALQYRKTSKRLSEIGRELPGINAVVSGTVMKTGNVVRITTQLSRTATDRVEWARPYEGELSRMLPLQQQIASEIAVAAGRKPTGSAISGKRRDIAPQAYEAYVKGLTARGELRPDAFRRAVGYFEQAIALDAEFAEAHAEMAFTQIQFLFGGPFSPHQIAPKVEAAARRALELDETLFQAHRALGQIFTLYHWRWAEGAKELERATALGHGREGSGAALNDTLLRERRFPEAIARAEQARNRDPLSVNAQVQVGTAYRAAGQYERSLAELQRARAMSPGDNRVQSQLGATYVAMGRLDDAIRALETAARPAHGHNSRMEAYLGYAYAAAGRTADARAVLTELEGHRKDQYVSWFGIALIHDALGEKLAAVAALQRACDDHAVEFAMKAQYPPFKAIASEPGFEAVMRKVGLAR
jgi:TolB-like protein/DNA-binding winged helix-turn-helix (wHTH) protein/Tfp pilus assembly protein PilF